MSLRKSSDPLPASEEWLRFDAVAAPSPQNAAGDLPTVDLDGQPLFGFLATYFEHGEAVPLAGAPVITSAAGGISALDVFFRPGEYKPGDMLSLAGPLPGGITAEWVTPDHLVLRGPAGGVASTDDMEAALLLVRYSSTGDANAGGDVVRSFSVTVTDANGTSAEEMPYVIVKNEQIATAEDDYLEGTAHDDSFNGLAGNDTIWGRAGNDTLDGGEGRDTLYGEDGDDLLSSSGAGVNSIHGGLGTDTLIADLSGAPGLYSYYGGQPATAEGYAGAASGAGWSLLYDGVERIQLTASAFGDSLIMPGTEDTIWLGAGDDFLYGAGGNKVIHAGIGNDTLAIGLTANDWFDGEDGVDTLNFSSALAGVIVSLAVATAQDTGGAGVDTYLNFERLIGGRFGDTLTGNGGANRLSGVGGSDTLTGGAGADVFAFENFLGDAALGPANIDTITDFEVGVDRLLLQRSLFGGVTAASLAAGGFTIGAAAQDADDRIVYDSATGALYFDADGDGAGAAIQFAILAPGLALGAADFVDANRAPEMVNATIAATEDQSYVFTLADFPFSDADGNALTEVRIVQLPATGTILYDADGPAGAGAGAAVAIAAGQYFPVAEIAAGHLIYVPVANANGAAAAGFTFTGRDTEGTIDTTSAQMTIAIAAVADAPVGGDRGRDMLEDGTLILGTSDFPFSDVDGDTLAAVFIDSVTGGVLRLTDALGATTILGGFPVSISAADIAAGRLAFLPDANGHGGDQGAILFRVSDGILTDPIANLIDVSVRGVNDPPSGTDGTLTINEDSARTLFAADFGFSDPVENSSFYGVRITSLPAGGYLTLNGVTLTSLAAGGTLVSWIQIGQGQLVFHPDAGENGSGYATLGFKVRDSGGTSNGGVDTDPTANVLTFDVTSVNDAPVLGSPGQALVGHSAGGAPAALFAGVTVTDPDGPANFAGGSLQLATSGAGAQIVLAGTRFTAQDVGGAFVLTDTTTSQEIGTMTVALGGTAVTLNAAATPEVVNALVQSFAFATVGGNPALGDRAASLTFYDGGNAGTGGSLASNMIQQTVSVAAGGPIPIAGTAGDDTIDGTPGDDTINGLGGDDILSGLGGNDTLDGGDDDDILFGGEGNDQIDGGAGNDLIDAGAGDDVVLGGTGRDDIIGGLGDDELHGGADTDFVFDTQGNNDALYGDGGDDLLGYGAILSGAVSDALLDGGDGDDEIHYFAYNFDDLGTLIGGDGNDRISSAGGDHIVINAGAGADLVEITNLGTRYDITLGAGSDRLWLNGFHDYFADSAGLIVADFAAGDAGDMLALTQYLTRVALGWDRTGNPFASGYLRVIQRGADAVVQLDRDGAADNAYGFADLAVLQNVTASALTAHNLSFAPDGSAAAGATITGTAGRDLLSGASGDDVILGLGGDDRLFGGAGNDRLEGGDGVDTLDGELGDDELHGGDGGDFMGDVLGGDDQLFGEGGRDFIQVDRQTAGTPPSTVLIDGGDDTDNLVFFGMPASGDNVTVNGGAGEDLITVFGGGAVTIDGGDGPEIITIDLTADSYAITLGPSPVDADIVSLQYTSSAIASFTIVDFVAGNGGDMLQMASFLTGALSGWDGLANPFATGHLRLARSGADAVILIDRDGGGDSFALLGRLVDVDAALLTNINLGFLPGAIAYAGTAGDDSIAGTAGADTMIGLTGNDVYDVDDAGDVVIELAGEGFDEIRTDLASYTLGNNLEKLTGLAATGQVLTGNGLDNVIAGNAGNDFLAGGIGADTMTGGLGDDTYYVDDGDDLANEAVDQGADRVVTSVSYALAAESEIEQLEAVNASATDAIDLTGNGFANTLYGNAGANFLNGGGGADAMVGFGGDDTYVVDDAGDQVVEAQSGGNDLVYALADYALTQGSSVETLSAIDWSLTNPLSLAGNGFANAIYGNAGANFLNGGGGADAMTGFGGDDVYVVDDAGDAVNESAGQGSDLVYALTSWQLTANSSVEILSAIDWSATNALNLTGNSLANVIYGNAGANFLNGGGGADAMTGFGGDDVYIVDNAGDAVNESAGQGSDVVYALANWALTANSAVEILSAIDWSATNALNLTGNGLANAIYGNAGANFLNGGGGADVMFGFGGDDVYIVDNAGDAVNESAGQGNDLVYALADYALTQGSSIETLSAIDWSQTNALNLSGNGLANTIYGNAGANFLNGGGGADVMFGFGGDDVYIVDNAGDAVNESAGQGSDLVYALADYALAQGSSVETLSAIDWSSTAALNLSGNGLANTLYGNAGANVLDGGLGADTLRGFGGADTFAFTTALGNGNVDAIVDFVGGTDRIALDDAVFAGLAPGALSANAFVIGAAAGDADDRIIYDQATGQLFYDADGNGAGAAVLFATLNGHPVIAASDFTVI